MIDAALNDATAVTVSANNDAMVRDSVDDELYILRFQVVETLLDDVVAVEILDHRNDLVLERKDQGANLLRSGHVFDHLLQRAGAMLIESDLDHVVGSIVDENSVVFGTGSLQELLAEIVSEGVWRDGQHIL